MKFSVRDYEVKDIIKFLRQYTGLTQRDFAKRINKSYDWVKSAESGRLKYKFEDLLMICDIFNINIIVESKESKKIFQEV